MSLSTQLPSVKRKKTSSARHKGKGRANLVPYSTPINSLDLPMAMRMPQEILNNIFNNLVDHPVNFTRVAQVCKSWQLAADTHLYWRHLVRELGLPPPKPKAKKFKTYKRVVERDWGKFCSLCFRGHRNGHERLSLREEKIDQVKVAEAYRDLNTNWFKIFKDNADFQISFGREYEILEEQEAVNLAQSEPDKSTDSNTKSNELEIIDKDQFCQNISAKSSNALTSLSSLLSSSPFVNNLSLPASSSTNNFSSTSSDNFLSTSSSNFFSSTPSNNGFSSTSPNNNFSSSNNNFLSTPPSNNFPSTSSSNSFTSTSFNDNFLSSEGNFSSTLSSNGSFSLPFSDDFSSLANFNFPLPINNFSSLSDTSADSTFYPTGNSTDLFFDYAINDNDYTYISNDAGIAQASSSQDLTSSSFTSKPDYPLATDQLQDRRSIFVKHHLCKTCKLYTGQNCERSSVLKMLIAEQKLPYTNFSKISMCANYVNNGIGNPVAIIRHLIEKRWFSEKTRYNELGSVDDEHTEKERRKLALEMWVRERIDNGILTSPRYDPVEGRAPKSLWIIIDQIIEEMLPVVTFEPFNLIELGDSDDNADQPSIIVIDDD